MKRAFLSSVAEVIEELNARGFFADCSALLTDSRQVGSQDVFLAVPGEKYDPRGDTDELLEGGSCGLVLVEHDDARTYQSAQVISVKGLGVMRGELARAYYGNPSASIRVVAVTGTNGKTTVTRWLAEALNALGEKAAVIGTLGYGLPDQLQHHTGLTTPDAVAIQRLLYRLIQKGFGWVCLEASSIGLEQGRLDGVQCYAAGYTNFSHDHLDFHGNLEAYAKAKMKLASWPGLKVIVANQDDEQARLFAGCAAENGTRVVTFGQSSEATIQLEQIEQTDNGLTMQLDGAAFRSPLVGRFNAYNLTMVYGFLISFKLTRKADCLRALTVVSPPPGRMEVVHRSPLVVVDYAHTPDALKEVLSALRPQLKAKAQGALRVVVGCGGDRDPAKRPVMAQVATELADQVYFTSDNPRTESPQGILDDMLKGVEQGRGSQVHSVVDRTQAIESCLSDCASTDVVLVAGKGHETTQIIGTEVLQFSDHEVVRSFFQLHGVSS